MIRVAVLMGGKSSERPVSLITGRECSIGLRASGYEVIEIDVGRDVARQLSIAAPDVCFNALHGPLGEDGSIQGLLNVMEIPYTHSGVAASSLAMNKVRSRDAAAALGISVPDGKIVSKENFLQHPPQFPFVLKPIDGGSSINTFVVKNPEKIPSAIFDWPFENYALLEEFVEGVELTVTVLDKAPLTVTQITTAKEFYDYSAKYSPGGSTHILPAPLPPATFDLCLEMAKQVHDSFQCRGISRTDFILPHLKSKPFFLEINTQPGMTPTSLSPEQAEKMGISFPVLMDTLVKLATTD